MMTISPRPGFNWMNVAWGGPDEPVSDHCSYCGREIPEESIPLIMWNEAGWCARFCDHCQAAWFGMENIFEEGDATNYELIEPPEDDLPSLGPCCGCETLERVINIVMLDRRCAVPGHGWACITCGLPSEGAFIVLCDGCWQRWSEDNSAISVACRGYPATEGRIAITELPEGKFEHDDSKHPEFLG